MILSLALAPIIAVHGGYYEYIGCYKAGAFDIIPAGIYGPDSCDEACAAYQYFGLSDRLCRCGDNYDWITIYGEATNGDDDCPDKYGGGYVGDFSEVALYEHVPIEEPEEATTTEAGTNEQEKKSTTTAEPTQKPTVEGETHSPTTSKPAVQTSNGVIETKWISVAILSGLIVIMWI